MPNAETFSVEPIHNFVWKYLSQSKVSIDPFARNKRWATYTNDLNPATEAEYHMDAEEFLRMLAGRGEKADLVIIDPPYSPRPSQGMLRRHWAEDEAGRRAAWKDAKPVAPGD
jgi:16S rRNA G966 N2-methylase RsmD